MNTLMRMAFISACIFIGMTIVHVLQGDWPWWSWPVAVVLAGIGYTLAFPERKTV